MTNTIKFDDILSMLGTGKWNIMYFAAYSYWVFLVPAMVLSGVYLAPMVEYECLPPKDFNVTSISEDSCSYYKNTTTPEGDTLREEVSCTDWEFDSSIYTSTLTSEFQLICGKAYLRATYQSMSWIASIFGAPLLGFLSDRFGRKRIVVIAMVSLSTLNILISQVTNFTLILALRFTLGFFSVTGMYVLCLEVCEVRNRSLVGILLSVPWALGTVAWGGMAYLIRDWRHLHLAVSLPVILLYPVLYLLDESPRGLILKGKESAAIKVLKRAFRWNKVQLPPDHELKQMFLDIKQEHLRLQKKILKAEAEKDRRCRTFYVPVLIRTPRIRYIMMMTCLMLFMTSLVFNGLSLGGDTYSTDPFLYLVISGLMELPSYTFTAPLIKWFGRKKPAFLLYFVSGISILALAFIPAGNSWLVFTLVMLGKMCISAANIILYILCAELIPTEVRLQGIGAGFTIEQIAAIIVPYIITNLGPLIPWFPSVLFGASSILAGLVLLTLPETLGKPMLETVAALENQHSKNDRSHNLTDEEQKQLTDTSTTC